MYLASSLGYSQFCFELMWTYAHKQLASTMPIVESTWHNQTLI